jgi:hypothetical protein
MTIFGPVVASRAVGRIESERERAVESHISRNTSEMWATRHSRGGEESVLQGLRPSS